MAENMVSSNSGKEKKNWFTNRVVEVWNKLSKHVVIAKTVNILKKGSYMDEENR